MIDITGRSGGATSGLIYDIHQIATSVLRSMGVDHLISLLDETSTSYGPCRIRLNLPRSPC